MGKFQIDDQIRFRYTGDSARITRDNLDGSYMVWSYDISEEIVAFEDDIILSRDFRQIELSNIRARHEKIKRLSTEDVFYDSKALGKTDLLNKALKKELEEQKEIRPVALAAADNEPKFIASPIRQRAATNSGLYLAFWQDAPQHYIVYLVNDTRNSIPFVYERYLNNYLQQELQHTIAPHDFYAVDEFRQGDFYESPIIDFRSKALHFETSLRLKYKSFIAKQREDTPLMSATTHLYQLFDHTYNPLEQQKRNLAEYTKQHLAEQPITLKVPQLSPTELRAQFPRVLDLHVEQLIDDPKKIVGSIIGFQLNKMDAYLLKATKLGIDSVVLIHGIGDGKLKDAVITRLRTHPLVLRMVNEHHPLYGFGATEVFLKG